MEGCCLFVTYQWGKPQAPIYRGNAEGQNLSASGGLPHGYVAEKTSPGASASGPEGTEKKPIVFRSIGVMQRSPFMVLPGPVFIKKAEIRSNLSTSMNS
jgi:hypothetical protein